MRDKLNAALKRELRAGNQVATATLRLILAALKDRDIAARSRGNVEGIDDKEILAMLATMVKQRRESAAMYEQGSRMDLMEQEVAEIGVIESFMPTQITGAALEDLVSGVIRESGASSLKDIGQVMAVIKERYGGEVNMGQASKLVKMNLGA